MLKAVSLFSNCGAGDVGYRDAGFKFRVMAELDPNRLSVALANHPAAVGVPGDLRQTWGTVVEQWRKLEGDGRPDLLAACPPCQGMSSARSGLGRHDDHEAGGRDPRNLLVTVIEAVVRELRPRSVVVENVPAFLSRAVPHPATGGPVSAAILLIKALQDDYHVSAMVSDLADWGVPQQRKRSFVTFVRNDEPGVPRMLRSSAFPVPTHSPDRGGKHVTIAESLKQLSAGALDAKSALAARDPNEPMHSVPVWDPQRYQMIASVPPNSGRGAWSNSTCIACGEVSTDPDSAVCALCNEPLPRPVVKTEEGWRLVRGFRTSSYTRMRADAPAATITTASGHVGSDRTVHPSENRVLSPLECAHLQTLPKDFKWGDALKRWGHTNVREMIGEAVPPLFTHAHGRAVRTILEDSPGGKLMPADDSRVLKASAALAAALAAADSAAAFPESTLAIG